MPDRIGGVIPAAPEAMPLPAVEGVLKPDPATEAGKTWSQLVGTWVQTGGGSDADFVEGGYRTSQLTFTEGGSLTVVRTFGDDGALKLTRRADFNLTGPRALVIGEKRQPGRNALIRERTVLSPPGQRPIVITPAERPMPAAFTFELTDATLKFAGKTYTRQK